MSSVQFLVLFSLQIFSTLGYEGLPIINLPELPLENLSDNWTEQIETLASILTTLGETSNVTLVGWQNVVDSNGAIKQINAIELTLLNQAKPEIQEHSTYIYNTGVLGDILALKEKLYNETNILLSASLGQWAFQGDQVNLLVVNRNQDVFILDQDIVYGLRNITVSNIQQVKELANTLKGQTNLPVGILSWNVNGELDLQRSTIVPQLLSSVTQSTNATQSMLDAALSSVSKAYLTQPENLLQQISHNMKETVPDYRWHVADGYYGFNFPVDVEIGVQYDSVPIGSDQIRIMLYGVKK